MNRFERKFTAEETLQILKTGGYEYSAGHQVDIKDELKAAVAGTELIRPEDFATFTLPDHHFTTRMETHNETTFAGAKAFLDGGAQRVCSLNFASAKNPGGGFMSGARAQEEDLALCSGLYHCLLAAPEFYSFHRADRGNALYSHHMIYAPGVPVFRNDRAELIETPWKTSIITSPAVNAGAVRSNTPEKIEQIEPVMKERINHLLTLAAARGETHLVLGGWGCGVFANDPFVIANMFYQALQSERFKTMFESVRFSVLDRTRDLTTYQAFKGIFG